MTPDFSCWGTGSSILILIICYLIHHGTYGEIVEVLHSSPHVEIGPTGIGLAKPPQSFFIYFVPIQHAMKPWKSYPSKAIQALQAEIPSY
jgi:hypothetical protein